MNAGVVQLRSAHADDALAIVAIYAEHVLHGTATFEIEPPDVTEMTSRMQSIADIGQPWIVATRDGRVVGYAYAGPYRLRPAYRFTTEDSIYLAPHALRQGIGRRLLDALIVACERRGDRQMIAVIGDSSNAASVSVHAAAGFTHVGVLRAAGRKFERWIDVVLMQRALGEGARTPPPGIGAHAEASR
ncbi:MAG: N-acetyltransferase family protein [Betaproteobacteria bacterium]